MFHYVYRIDDTSTGKYYFGSRSCSCLPEKDTYMGSMINWAKQTDFNIARCQKKILKSNFSSREEAYIFERQIILKHKLDPLNQNYGVPSVNGRMGGLPGERNAFYGKTHTEEVKRKIKENRPSVKGENNPMWGKHFSDESKKKMREKKLGLYDGANNPRAKEIFQYDLNGNLIKKWNCATDCVNYYKQLNIKFSRGNMSGFAKHNSIETNRLKRLNLFIFSFVEIYNLERFYSKRKEHNQNSQSLK